MQGLECFRASLMLMAKKIDQRRLPRGPACAPGSELSLESESLFFGHFLRQSGARAHIDSRSPGAFDQIRPSPVCSRPGSHLDAACYRALDWTTRKKPNDVMPTDDFLEVGR